MTETKKCMGFKLLEKILLKLQTALSKMSIRQYEEKKK